MSLRVTYDETDPDTGLRVTTTTTAEGHTRRFLINDAWQVVAETDPVGAVTRYRRDLRSTRCSPPCPWSAMSTARTWMPLSARASRRSARFGSG